MSITKVSRNLLSTGISDSSDATAITITSDEEVGIGTTTPNSYAFNDPAKLVVANTSGHSTISLVSGTSSKGYFAFADGTSGTARYSGSVQYDHSSNYLSFHTLDGTQNARIDADGLKFGSDTAAANALDDYEEGIHVATITCGTSGTVTLNGAYSDLSYTKIGRIVTVTGLLIVSSVSSPVGHYLVSLPFTCANLTDRAADSAVTIQHHYGYNAGAGSYTAFLPEGYSAIHVYRGDVGTTRSSTSAEEIRAGTQIVVSVTYVVA